MVWQRSAGEREAQQGVNPLFIGGEVGKVIFGSPGDFAGDAALRAWVRKRLRGSARQNTPGLAPAMRQGCLGFLNVLACFSFQNISGTYGSESTGLLCFPPRRYKSRVFAGVADDDENPRVSL
jgi:hypothetical protein